MTATVTTLRPPRAQPRRPMLRAALEQHFLDAIREGRDESLGCGPDGMTTAEWLVAADGGALFRLVHLALNRDNLAAIHEAADELARQAARDFAEQGAELLESAITEGARKPLDDAGRRLASLTAREREVARHMVQHPGERQAGIATALGISGATLRHHLSAIYGKLELPGRLALHVFAADHGLWQPVPTTLQRS